jgi:hydroxymethylbilane synthase
VGIFTSAIEQALLAGEVDVAVHSMKDLPTAQPEGLTIAAVPQRHSPEDVLVADGDQELDDLPEGSTVLTGSPRRKAQVLHARPDLEVKPVTGNVPTRLEKRKEQGAAALVLAFAGLDRLGLAKYVSSRMDPDQFIPSPGQGALAVQVRSDDADAIEACRAIDHRESHLAVAAERAMLARLGAGCSVPAGGYATIESGTRLRLTGMVAEPDGSRLLRETEWTRAEDPEDAAELGRTVAERLCERGADKILEQFERNGGEAR